MNVIELAAQLDVIIREGDGLLTVQIPTQITGFDGVETTEHDEADHIERFGSYFVNIC